jgi:hypothetical protein
VAQLLDVRVEKGKNLEPNTPIEIIFRTEIPLEGMAILFSIDTGVIKVDLFKWLSWDRRIQELRFFSGNGTRVIRKL